MKQLRYFLVINFKRKIGDKTEDIQADFKTRKEAEDMFTICDETVNYAYVGDRVKEIVILNYSS